ncbi:hypothetical protein FraQA3DRAFT_6008 [Frankia sp. QA3]|nr:hypothetical protein FraQA3DRAFT_6008 [Frankia sp. QA3]
MVGMSWRRISEGMAMKILKGFRYLVLAVVLACAAFLTAVPAGAAPPPPAGAGPATAAPTSPPPKEVEKPHDGPKDKKGQHWICRPGYWEPGYWIPGFWWHHHWFPKKWQPKEWHPGYCYWGRW